MRRLPPLKALPAFELAADRASISAAQKKRWAEHRKRIAQAAKEAK
jgi:hypothetical protein